MSSAYLEESYTFDVDMLIEPIRKSSVARNHFMFMTELNPWDLEIDLTDVEDDLNIAVNVEPFDTPTSKNALNRNTYQTAVMHGEVSYPWDELQRINSSKLPMTERVRLVGYQLGQVTDGMLFAASSTGLQDGDHQPLLENGTSFDFDLDDYTTARDTVGQAIAAINTNLGNIQQYPLKFFINDKAFETLIQQHNANTDNSALTAIRELLTMFGGPGSGIFLTPRLGCALTVSGDVVNITNEADEAAALMSLNPAGFSILDSPLDDRPRPTTKADGFYTKIVQRILARVHKANAIQYDIDATP